MTGGKRAFHQRFTAKDHQPGLVLWAHCLQGLLDDGNCLLLGYQERDKETLSHHFLALATLIFVLVCFGIMLVLFFTTPLTWSDSVFSAQGEINSGSTQILRSLHGETTSDGKVLKNLLWTFTEKTEDIVDFEVKLELADIPHGQMQSWNANFYKPVHLEQRVKRTRWVVLRWPHPAMAQQAQMSTERFEDFYFNTCTLDYPKMSRAMDPLVALMERTDKVRIVSPDGPLPEATLRLVVPDGSIRGEGECVVERIAAGGRRGC